MNKQKLPTGYSEERIRKIADHYDGQSEDAALAEDESAFARGEYTMIQVPTALVEDVQRLVSRRSKRAKRPQKVNEKRPGYGES